ncbi:MAG: glycerophosphodiester phosphodiesterase family protein [Rhodobacterales bacterium]|nr:glycerophosphodiester phosphodiesterase family protein [Rhodobacterales bacterium]
MTRVPLPAAFLRLPLAHRGLHDHPHGVIENSLTAFRAAINAGYGIELDVQRSADDVAVVFHDDDMHRLTDATGAFRDHSAATLGRTVLRGSTDTIPTLADVLALVAGKVPLLVEIKENWNTMEDTDGILEQAVATALATYEGPVAVMAFNPHCIAHMARFAPDLPRGLTTEAYDPVQNAPIPAEVCDHLREIPDYDRTRSSFISHQVTDLGRPRVAALKAQGAAVLCWTVRSPAAEAKARQIADNVTFEGYLAKLPA